jgi:quercetin dioxygenase-like cupin family protein
MSKTPIIKPISEVPANFIDGCAGVSLQVLLGPDDGMPNFYTRIFTIAPGGHIPAHLHPTIEHEQVMLEGEMVLTLDGVEHVVAKGQTMYLPAGVAHAYDNRGDVEVRFLCAIPAGDYATEWTDK